MIMCYISQNCRSNFGKWIAFFWGQVNAFGLNVAIAVFLKYLSPVTYILVGRLGWCLSTVGWEPRDGMRMEAEKKEISWDISAQKTGCRTICTYIIIFSMEYLYIYIYILHICVCVSDLRKVDEISWKVLVDRSPRKPQGYCRGILDDPDHPDASKLMI